MPEHGPEKITKENRVDPYSPERAEALEVARNKMEKLLDKDFQNFAVRFMNIGEYEEMVRTGIISSREAVIIRDLPFKKFTTIASEPYTNRRIRWGNAKHYTGWENGIANITGYNSLMSSLRSAAKEVAEIPDMNTDERRIATLRKFREKILRYQVGALRWAGHYEHDKATLARLEKEIAESADRPDQQKTAEIARIKDRFSFFSEEKFKILSDFINNPEYLDDGKMVKEVISILTFSPEWGRHETTRQYHVMVVFDSDALSGNRSWQGIADWEYLRAMAEENYDPKDTVLGVVAMIPDTGLIDELIDKSSGSDKLAHVVLDHKARVRYPKEHTE